MNFDLISNFVHSSIGFLSFTSGDDIKCDKILPLIWFEYSGEISTRDAAVLRENVVKVIDHATLYKPIYLISGFMFAIVAVALGYFKYHQVIRNLFPNFMVYLFKLISYGNCLVVWLSKIYSQRQ